MLLVIKGRLGGHRFTGLKGWEGRADLAYTGHGLTYDRVVSGGSAQSVRREKTLRLETAPAYSCCLGCRKTRRGMSTI